MSITRPNASPLFATDATFTSGSESGLAPRLDPGSGVRGQGVLAESRLAARWENFLIGNHGDWINYFDQHSIHAAAQTWRKTPLVSVNTTSYQFLVGVRQSNAIAPAFGSSRQRLPFAIGPAGADSLKPYTNRLTDGAESETSPSPTGLSLTSATDVIAGASGVVVITNGPAFVYTTNFAGTWSTWSPGFATNVRAMHFADLAGFPSQRYFFAQANGTISYTSTVAGATSSASLPGGVAITNATTAEFADDGNFVCVLLCHVASNAFPTLFYTNNAGGTWAKGIDLGGTTGNVTYNKALGLFVAWDTTGQLRTSPDGASWTTSGGTTGTVANGLATGVASMASLGPAIVKLATVGGTGGNGIAYTLDGGVSWTNYTVGGYFSNYFQRVKGFNGRLYLLAVDALWTSGSLNVPAVGDF